MQHEGGDEGVLMEMVGRRHALHLVRQLVAALVEVAEGSSRRAIPVATAAEQDPLQGQPRRAPVSH